MLNYSFIAIGEFSHGIQESWEYRFKLLKKAIKKTNKKIIVFNEQSIWQAENIMNNTIWSVKDKKYIKCDTIMVSDPIITNNYVGGKLWQYINHAMESNIFFKIIKYIRKHKNRITLIGIDNDKIDRDYDMYKIIMSFYNKNNLHFLWASNDHISVLHLTTDNLKYINNKEHKWFLGYYLKKKLKDNYFIILTQAYTGSQRFNGYCYGTNCENRTFQLDYFYKSFTFAKHKKYLCDKNKYTLIKDFNNTFITFSNSYFVNNKSGYQHIYSTNVYNYVLFFNSVTPLIPFEK